MAAINSCAGCDRRWTGTSEAHCASCHHHFSGVTHFDAHRRDGHCVDPATIRGKDGQPALRLSERPNGPVWHSATPWPFSAAHGGRQTLESTPEED